MRQSKLFTKTRKEIPKREESINAKLLLRAGFVYKEMAGVYTFLPLGLRVLNKIENIIREEMNKIGGQEIMMTVLQPKSIWEESGRWEKKKTEEIMYRFKVDNNEIALGPTHEEMITDIIRNYVDSYQNLPIYVYQIQTKFRKEARVKSGILRNREFRMKDLYSFHKDKKDFLEFYNIVKKSYLRILKKCGLDPIVTQASGGGFSKENSHEFQVLAEAGEDTIFYCPKKHFSLNKEISKVKEGDRCPLCGAHLKKGKSIEVANIFSLGTTYSKAMRASFKNEKGKKKDIVMGCYGLGSTRIMGSVVEVHHDKKGMIWPKSIAPFSVHLLSLPTNKKSAERNIDKTSEKLYYYLQNKGIEVFYDDRKGKTAGEKFADCDLIGIPVRIVISEKALSKKKVEVRLRERVKPSLIKIESLSSYIKKLNV